VFPPHFNYHKKRQKTIILLFIDVSNAFHPGIWLLCPSQTFSAKGQTFAAYDCKHHFVPKMKLFCISFTFGLSRGHQNDGCLPLFVGREHICGVDFAQKAFSSAHRYG